MDRAPEVAAFLSDELDRVQIVRGGVAQGAFARMGSRVVFRDNSTGRTQSVTLVYPGEADIEQGKVSILTPIGAALIGLSKGQSINWATRTGETRRLTVLEVREAAFA
ncbi:nucleoside diphosphate kinase regulator [Methylorubrum extorquens]|uniref:Nucleoside diphosphate kinase regulator n=1 Tax=Methylorubrum extorquens TaxID=408 RepID=A0A1S1P3U2_METEX|nr:nucleoside diphosphate kinase regulator [Methylorubrum extorquens]